MGDPVVPFEVAIIGGGITGVTLAIALQARSVPFRIYERAASFGEIGAGIGFSPNAEAAMAAIDPVLVDAYRRVANPNQEDYFEWVDGFETDEVIFKLYLGKDGFRACRRADFLDEIVKLVPADRVSFGKCLENIGERAGDGRLQLTFQDGTTSSPDVVVGCDGIWSRVRPHVVGPDHPSARPSFSKKVCFRALIPMEEAKRALPESRKFRRVMYNGPGAHLIHYPVGMNTLLNVLVVISQEEWAQSEGKHTGKGSKSLAQEAFRGWHATSRGIVDLLPDDGDLDTWAIFDMFEHPAPTFCRGRVCIAGDAAHAAGPHLGAGGGMGIEDALVLAAGLDKVRARVQRERGDADTGADVAGLLVAALEKYDVVRRPRTQDAVRHTREAVDLFQWKDEARARDFGSFGREITWRFHNIWRYDVSKSF